MTKGDANTNNDFQLLYSPSKPSEQAMEHDAYKKELITNTSLIRYACILKLRLLTFA